MDNLIEIEQSGQRVLTTEQLAQAYGCNAHSITKNYSDNKERFVEGQHYFKLMGDDLKEFKNRVTESDLVGKNANQLILWTRRGASRHCKMLGTDQAWDMFDQLEDTYFNPKPAIPELSPQLQVLINMEMRQKEQAQQLADTNKRIDDIKDVVALSASSWRKDTGALINRMAMNLGGNDHIKPLRVESYKLLDERMGVSTQTRLTNLRRRMAEDGVCKSKRDSTNILDVIDKDKKLIEGYVGVIKDMAVKYGPGCQEEEDFLGE